MATVRSVTVELFNASTAEIILNHGSLAGGVWDDNNQPQPGSTISRDSASSYVNGADDMSQALGGTILLTPASGGSITVTWAWPFGSGVSCTVAPNSLSGLAVTSAVFDQDSNTPILRVIVTTAIVIGQLIG